MSATTAALHPFSVVTNLLLTGKRFSGGFFGDLHRQLLFTSPTTHRAPPHIPQAKKLQRPACTCAGFHYQRDAKRGYTHGFLPDWLNHHQFPTRAQKGQIFSAALPPRCKPASRTPPVT